MENNQDIFDVEAIELLDSMVDPASTETKFVIIDESMELVPATNVAIVIQLRDLISSKLAPQTSTERQILQDKTPGQHLNWLQQRAEAQAIIEQAIRVLSQPFN